MEIDEARSIRPEIQNDDVLDSDSIYGKDIPLEEKLYPSDEEDAVSQMVNNTSGNLEPNNSNMNPGGNATLEDELGSYPSDEEDSTDIAPVFGDNTRPAHEETLDNGFDFSREDIDSMNMDTESVDSYELTGGETNEKQKPGGQSDDELNTTLDELIDEAERIRLVDPDTIINGRKVPEASNLNGLSSPSRPGNIDFVVATAAIRENKMNRKNKNRKKRRNKGNNPLKQS